MQDFLTRDIEAGLHDVRASHPLVHSITNYVTVNDCANVLLALEASPIMSDEPEDVEDITSICNALVINIGTLNEQTIKGMKVAAARASELGHSIVLDPVGAGASRLRTRVATEILDAYDVTMIRGNMSEIKAVMSGARATRGVDVAFEDVITPENMRNQARIGMDLAQKTGCIVAITGPTDLVCSAESAYALNNGSAWQGRITGAGCMLSCVCGAFAGLYPEDSLRAALCAVGLMGIAGEMAALRMERIDGNASYRTYLLDALCRMSTEDVRVRLRMEKLI